MDASTQGLVRVGSCHYVGGKQVNPKYEGFTQIVCLTKSSPYGMLGPYCLTIEKKFSDGQVLDVVFENYWQMSKVYERVPEACESKSRFDRTVIWRWPAESHCIVTTNPESGQKSYKITPEYLRWREAGMKVAEPIRYPVGKSNMHKCLFSLAENEDGILSPIPLDYVAARKEIYAKGYVKALKTHVDFHKLKSRLARGENLLIIEVDCCQERSLPYYKAKYGVDDTFIQNGTMLVTAENINIMLNDTKERFGHGYCLAAALLGLM